MLSVKDVHKSMLSPKEDKSIGMDFPLSPIRKLKIKYGAGDPLSSSKNLQGFSSNLTKQLKVHDSIAKQLNESVAMANTIKGKGSFLQDGSGSKEGAFDHKKTLAKNGDNSSLLNKDQRVIISRTMKSEYDYSNTKGLSKSLIKDSVKKGERKLMNATTLEPRTNKDIDDSKSVLSASFYGSVHSRRSGISRSVISNNRLGTARSIVSTLSFNDNRTKQKPAARSTSKDMKQGGPKVEEALVNQEEDYKCSFCGYELNDIELKFNEMLNNYSVANPEIEENPIDGSASKEDSDDLPFAPLCCTKCHYELFVKTKKDSNMSPLNLLRPKTKSDFVKDSKQNKSVDLTLEERMSQWQKTPAGIHKPKILDAHPVEDLMSGRINQLDDRIKILTQKERIKSLIGERLKKHNQAILEQRKFRQIEVHHPSLSYYPNILCKNDEERVPKTTSQAAYTPEIFKHHKVDKINFKKLTHFGAWVNANYNCGIFQSMPMDSC